MIALLLAALVAVPSPSGLYLTTRAVGSASYKAEFGWKAVPNAASYLYRVDGGASINTTARTATVTLARSPYTSSLHTFCVASRFRGGATSSWACISRGAPASDSLKVRLFQYPGAPYDSGTKHITFAEYKDTAWVCPFEWAAGKAIRDTQAKVGVLNLGGGRFTITATMYTTSADFLAIAPGEARTVNLPPPLPSYSTDPLPTTFVHATGCVGKLAASAVWPLP